MAENIIKSLVYIVLSVYNNVQITTPYLQVTLATYYAVLRPLYYKMTLIHNNRHLIEQL